MWLKDIEIHVEALAAFTRLQPKELPRPAQKIQRMIQANYRIIFDSIDAFIDEHIEVNPTLDYNPNANNSEEGWFVGWSDLYDGWLYFIEDTIDFKAADTDIQRYEQCIQRINMHEFQDYILNKLPGVSVAIVGDNGIADLNDYGYSCNRRYLNIRVKKMNAKLHRTIESYPKDLWERLQES